MWSPANEKTTHTFRQTARQTQILKAIEFTRPNYAVDFAKRLDNPPVSVYNKDTEFIPKGIFDMDCIFCKIIAGDIPSAKVYEDELVYAFRDIAPMAPTHILIVPKVHMASADEVTSENSGYVARIFEVIPKIAATEGLTKGYRVITNCGEDGCQSVKHLHFHLLGGKQLPAEMA